MARRALKLAHGLVWPSLPLASASTATSTGPQPTLVLSGGPSSGHGRFFFLLLSGGAEGLQHCLQAFMHVADGLASLICGDPHVRSPHYTFAPPWRCTPPRARPCVPVHNPAILKLNIEWDCPGSLFWKVTFAEPSISYFRDRLIRRSPANT